MRSILALVAVAALSQVAAVSQVADTTPPAITVTVPKSGQHVKALAAGRFLAASGRATDAGGVASVTVNGKVARLSEDGTWERDDVTPRAGRNTLVVVATDRAGNRVEKRVTYYYDAPGGGGGDTDGHLLVKDRRGDAGGGPLDLREGRLRRGSRTVTWTLTFWTRVTTRQLTGSPNGGYVEIVAGGRLMFTDSNRGRLGATYTPGMRRIRVTRPNARSVRFHVPAKLVFGGRRPWSVLTSYIGGSRCPKRGSRPDTQKCVDTLRSG